MTIGAHICGNTNKIRKNLNMNGKIIQIYYLFLKLFLGIRTVQRVLLFSKDYETIM